MRINTKSRNSKHISGMTLLELLIAMSLVALVLLAGSGIYLSGMNISLGAQQCAQAHRNAGLVIMHIEKNVYNAATEFIIYQDGAKTNTGNELEFKTYNTNEQDYFQNPSVTKRYFFDKDQKKIIFTQDDSNQMIFNNIKSCIFEKKQNDGIVLYVIVEACDKKEENTCILNTCVEAGLTSSNV